MDRRTYNEYCKGVRQKEVRSVEKQKIDRYCHACGNPLSRRIYHSMVQKHGFVSSKTESKEDFAARHFCNALCRAACRGARIATVHPARFV